MVMALTWRKGKGRLRRMTRSIFPTLVGMIVGISATLIFTTMRRLPHDICNKLLTQVCVAIFSLKFENRQFCIILFLDIFTLVYKIALANVHFMLKNGSLLLRIEFVFNFSLFCD